MFLAALIIALIAGFVLKGSVKNIDATSIKGLYFVFAAFFLEYMVLTLLRRGYLAIGTITLIADIVMYTMLVYFVFLNRKNKWILLMGAGVALNAIVIFANGGVMPVSESAVRAFGITGGVAARGLYELADSNTKFVFLADIISLGTPRLGIASIGDIIECVGLAMFIITEMRNKPDKNNLAA